MSESTKKHWTFAAVGRFREPFVARSEPPSNYLNYSLSLIEPFLGSWKSASEVSRTIQDLGKEVITADMLVIRDAPEGPSIGRDLDTLGETIFGHFAARPSVAVLRSNGSSPTYGMTLELITGTAPADSDILLQVRALELFGHIRRSAAIYEAQDAHYQLPSGMHAGKYVRVADVFDDPVVAVRLADWLQHRIRPESILLADSWTLMPLLQELSGRGATQPHRHPVIAFPEYPGPDLINRVLDLVAAEAASLERPHIFFITSVVGTGHFLNRIAASARQRLPEGSFESVVLVSSHAHEASADILLALGDDPVADLQTDRFAVRSGDECKLCHNARRSAVILIDHKKYFPHVQISHREFMVTPAAATLHRTFWEFASRRNAIGVHVDEKTSGRPRHLPIDIRAHVMLADPWFKEDISQRIVSANGPCDLVLIPRNLSTDALQAIANRAYPEARQFVIERGPQSDPFTEIEPSHQVRFALGEMLRGVRHILLLDEVLVTGATLRSTHRLVQETIHQLGLGDGPANDYQLAAYVVFATPHDLDQWNSLVGSLRDEGSLVRLATAHCIPMPTGPCPWCQELSFLTDVSQGLRRVPAQDELIRKALEVLDIRLAVLHYAGSSANEGLDSSLFLCSSGGTVEPRDRESISRHSLFGEGLGEATAFAAVATAVHSVRDCATTEYGPRAGRSWSWRLDRLINVYHDPILQASLLRCFKPSELLGVDRARMNDAIQEVLFPAGDPALRQSALLAAEHALAAIQGTYPLDLRSTVIDSASKVLNQWSSPVRSVVDTIAKFQSVGPSRG